MPLISQPQQVFRRNLIHRLSLVLAKGRGRLIVHGLVVVRVVTHLLELFLRIDRASAEALAVLDKLDSAQ